MMSCYCDYSSIFSRTTNCIRFSSIVHLELGIFECRRLMMGNVEDGGPVKQWCRLRFFTF